MFASLAGYGCRSGKVTAVFAGVNELGSVGSATRNRSAAADGVPVGDGDAGAGQAVAGAGGGSFVLHGPHDAVGEGYCRSYVMKLAQGQGGACQVSPPLLLMSTPPSLLSIRRRAPSGRSIRS